MTNETGEQKVRIIVTVPNQKVVRVRHEICDADHIYTMCNVKANSAAMKELSANTYKLYMYFDLNQDGYLFALSYKAVHEATGMSDKTYQKAIKELIEKGYLVQSEEQSNLYIFYDGKDDSRKVEITQRNRKESTTSSKEVDASKGKMFGDRQSESTGEILQDSTIDNTIDINLFSKETDINNLRFLSEKCIPDDDIKYYMKSQYKRYVRDGVDDVRNSLIYDFTSKSGWYKCRNNEAVSAYADYLLLNPA